VFERKSLGRRVGGEVGEGGWGGRESARARAYTRQLVSQSRETKKQKEDVRERVCVKERDRETKIERG